MVETNTWEYYGMISATACTEFPLYTPVYDGPTSLLVFSYVIDPLRSTDFIEDLSGYISGFFKKDPLCKPTNFALLPLVDPLTGYD